MNKVAGDALPQQGGPAQFPMRCLSICCGECAVLPLCICVQTSLWVTCCLDSLLLSILLVQIVNFFKLFLTSPILITQSTIQYSSTSFLGLYVCLLFSLRLQDLESKDTVVQSFPGIIMKCPCMALGRYVGNTENSTKS